MITHNFLILTPSSSPATQSLLRLAIKLAESSVIIRYEKFDGPTGLSKIELVGVQLNHAHSLIEHAKQSFLHSRK